MTVLEKLSYIAETEPMLYNGAFRKGQFDTINSAEVLKGNEIGSVVKIDDISPIEHNLDVRVSSPHIADLSNVVVSRYGKNLFPVTAGSANGMTLSKYDDYYVMNGTATGSGFFMVSNVYLPAGTYTLSANNPQHNNLNTQPIVQIYSPTTFESFFIADSVVNGSSTMNLQGSNDYWCRIRYEEGIKYDNYIIKPQLELGATSTLYEPYIEPQNANANADGTVEGIDYLYPSLTLTTDTDGTVVNVNYIKDIDKTFNKLEAQIVALGSELA